MGLMLQETIERVLGDNIRGNVIDICGLADATIGIAIAAGGLKGEYAESYARPRQLRFTSPSEQCVVITSAPLLRHICARLAIIAGSALGRELKLYGDEAEFLWHKSTAETVMIRLRFQNHHERWFELAFSERIGAHIG